MQQNHQIPAEQPEEGAPPCSVGIERHREASRGIEVAMVWLHVVLQPSATTWRTATPETALRELVERVRHGGPVLVAVEAMGGYERLVVALRATAEVPSRWSIPVRCAPLPKRPGASPRHMRSMLRCWPPSPRPCAC